MMRGRHIFVSFAHRFIHSHPHTDYIRHIASIRYAIVCVEMRIRARQPAYRASISNENYVWEVVRQRFEQGRLVFRIAKSCTCCTCIKCALPHARHKPLRVSQGKLHRAIWPARRPTVTKGANYDAYRLYLPELQRAVFGHVGEVLVGGQHGELVADAKLRQESVDGAELKSGAAAFVA